MCALATTFVDRGEELRFLESAWRSDRAELIVLTGRRRIGKTSLLREFASKRPACHYVATRLPESQQLAELGRAVGEVADEPLLARGGFADWEQVFDFLARPGQRLAFVLDEFPYLVEANPALSSLWQRAWDQRLSRTGVFVVLCGSSIAMMEREVLGHAAPLYGRRTGQLELGPLGFGDAQAFLAGYGFDDRVRTYAVTGGVPYYLLLFDDRQPVTDNIEQRVLALGAALRDEVEFLLRQELREPRVYFGILLAMAQGKRKPAEIANATGLSSAALSKYLSVLQGLGIVEREVPVTQPRPDKSKMGLYRIREPFVRFWFRFVLPQRGLLETGRIRPVVGAIAGELDVLASSTYEDICRDEVRRGLLDEATGHRWLRCGRWWDRTAELDLVAIDEAGGAALFGECKFSRRPVGLDVLRGLEAAAGRVPLEAGRRLLALFSRSGFSQAVRRAAGERDDLVLVEGLRVAA